MNMRHIWIAVLGLSSLTGCGKWAKAKKMDVVAVAPPAYPSIADNVFALKGGKSSISYKSTMLILNPTGNTTQLADLIRASEVARVKAADAKTFVGNEKIFDSTYGDTGTVITEITKKQEELKKFVTEAQGRASPIPLAQRQDAAARWFPEAAAQLTLSPEDSQRLQATWAGYCDAKIVEFAAHPIFAKLAVDGYKQRPSPDQLCESYYKDQAYFEGESCKNGDYFTCLWVDGVMKSGKLLSQNGQSLASLLQPIFDDKTKTEDFRIILASDESISSGIVKPPAGPYKDNIFTKKTYFNGFLLNGKAIGTEAKCKEAIPAEYGFICGSFSRTWKDETPLSFIKLVELTSGLLIGKDSAELKSLSDSVKYFGQRPTGNALPSNSDILFHDLVVPGTLTQPTNANLGLSQDSVTMINALFLDKVFPYLNPEDKAVKVAQEQELAALQQKLNFYREERSRLSNVSGEALDAGIRAANAGDIAFGFIAYRMTVAKADDLMRATIAFELPTKVPKEIFEACYDTDKLVSIDCPVDPEASKSDVLHKATLNLNSAKGRIEFSLLVDNPEAWGLGAKAKNPSSPDYFMLLQPEQIQGTTLRFELYPNRLQGSLDILTGKTLFSKDGKDLFEAGISMWEE